MKFLESKQIYLMKHSYVEVRANSKVKHKQLS